MQKNSICITEYLNYVGETWRLWDMGEQAALLERAIDGRGAHLYRECLENGWSEGEVDAAYIRRFGER
jgi:hypothetical protein